jgi:hypothetical protein
MKRLSRVLCTRPRPNYKARPGRVASTEGVEAAPGNVSNRERNITMKILAFVSALALGMSVSSAAFALDAATPDKPDATAKAERAAECSKRADARGLHGKKRREYREECKKGKEDKDIKDVK